MNLPTSRAEQLRSARGLEVELSQGLGRSPTIEELAHALGRSESWTAGLLAHQRPRSLELVDGPAIDRLRADDDLDEVLADPLPIRELLLRLDDLDRQVIHSSSQYAGLPVEIFEGIEGDLLLHFRAL